MSDANEIDYSDKIAVIGMSGRFPGASSIDVFWQNLCDGVESITFFSDQELASAGVDADTLHNPRYIKAGAILEGIELFDAAFFGFTPREVEIMDPQHRLFLECAWEALETAGYAPRTSTGRIGIYAGASLSSYLLNNLHTNRDHAASLGDIQTLIGNDKDYLTTLVSYKLNLTGPSITVQTACSSSLVAVHLACESLLNSECDLALAGGVTINIPHKAGYFYQEEGILSPDGHCRAFDARAQGTVGGNGAGVVVLRRLEDALASGDSIQAVIIGSAVNNDGSGKIGFTAPSIDGQATVIAEALAMAGVEPRAITYIEAHGTGTPLGDAIELAALTQALYTPRIQAPFCAIGSVKTNIGHLDTASGIAGLIKTILALKHKLIPPSLHFEQPNTKIDLEHSPFYVNTILAEWEAEYGPRRAGVNSFGIGGTNAHIVLEEAPAPKRVAQHSSWQLLVLSAKTRLALERSADNLLAYLSRYQAQNHADTAYTYQIGRSAFSHRMMLVCHSAEDALRTLEARDPRRILTSVQAGAARDVAFMFPGLGDQYVNMALELYQTYSAFREQVDRCSAILSVYLGLDLRDVLYPRAEQAKDVDRTQEPVVDVSKQRLDLRAMLAPDGERFDAANQRLTQTFLLQPTFFVIEYAVAQLWMALGVHAKALIGYSIGEYVAACLAGVFSLEDALMLVAKRAKMIEALPDGAMLAVRLSERDIQPLLGANLSLAAVNGPLLCTVSGPRVDVADLANHLTAQGVACRYLRTTHAFHSQMMESVVDSFYEVVKTISLQPPQIPFISTVTGTWITTEEATDSYYWARHMCQPVRFAAGVRELLQEENWILLEVGPGQTLCTLAEQQIDVIHSGEQIVLPSLRSAYEEQSDIAYFLNTVGKLWLNGVQIDWSVLHDNQRRYRIPLPTYPFERQRYWIEPSRSMKFDTKQIAPTRKNISDWFYIPSWKRSMRPKSIGVRSLAQQTSCWLVFVDDIGIGAGIIERLREYRQDVVILTIGSTFSKLSEDTYAINPQVYEDYNRLMEYLHTQNKVPQKIVHLWNLTANSYSSSSGYFENAQYHGFCSLIFIAQTFGRFTTIPLEIWVISNDIYSIESRDIIVPEKTTLLAACKIIPQEYKHISCQSIEIAFSDLQDRSQQKLIDLLIAEFGSQSLDAAVAYRGNHRWLQSFEAVPLDSAANQPMRLRKAGIYLIIGGLGRVGLALADYLVTTVSTGLALVDSCWMPPNEEWEQWLTDHDHEDAVSQKIRKVQHLERLGADILIINADPTNEERMRAAMLRANERFGMLHGVVYATNSVDTKDFKTIAAMDPVECSGYIKSHVQGLYILQNIVCEKTLDFCLLISSLSSIVGGVGNILSAGSGLFVDAFAQTREQADFTRWISVNWDICQPMGGQAAPATTPTELDATREESIDVLQRILSADTISQFIISTEDLQVRIRSASPGEKEPTRSMEGSENIEALAAYPRPGLRSAYVAPGNQIEQKIVEIWQDLFGIEEVGINDNFLELGGHSLLGIALISRINAIFAVNITLVALFQTPTVAELAQLIEDRLDAKSG